MHAILFNIYMGIFSLDTLLYRVYTVGTMRDREGPEGPRIWTFLVLFGPLRPLELFGLFWYFLGPVRGLFFWLRDCVFGSGLCTDSADSVARTGVEKPAHAQRCSGAGFNSASPTVFPLCHSVSSASLSHCFYYIKKDAKSLFLLDSFRLCTVFSCAIT